MGWYNGSPRWSEFERVLSGRAPSDPAPGDGNDAPAWSRRRAAYRAPELSSPANAVPYAELHAHSNFSFLDGASHPEDMVEQAQRLGLKALALTDHNGFYGIVRFAEAAKELGLPTVFGSEVTLHPDTPRTGVSDPAGDHLVILARDHRGYQALSRQLTAAHMAAGTKGKLRVDIDMLAAAAQNRWLVLTGCRKGALPRALAGPGSPHERHDAGVAAVRALTERFGAANVAVEMTPTGSADDHVQQAALAAVAAAVGVPVVATTGAHMATPRQRRLAMAMAAVRANQTLTELAGYLPAYGSYLRSGDEMARLLPAHPEALDNAVQLAHDCAFDLRLIAPNLPPFTVPAGYNEAQWLRELTFRGAARRYGPAANCPAAYRQLRHELDVITALGFPGYFLIVHDIVDFCARNNILCQGRGSAANSAVCYALAITNVDPVGNGLLFERFLSAERDGPPDIDIDIESDRREEVIQYVFQRYDRQHAAQVANVITYRGRSSVRDMAKALGYSVGQQNAWSKRVSHYDATPDPGADIPAAVLTLAREIRDYPRHLGVHSCGMVICDRPISEVVPTEWATMPGRSVVQWDKDDCAAVGLVKFDLLGLGMLSAIHYALDLLREHRGLEVELHTLDLGEPAVYDMLCAADTIGVFQVESRAQMATLPRLRPRCFFDLVVEVALIRPGPIQGGSVHPYIRRRQGHEPVTYEHPAMEKALAKTLGVPLFQEQLMQLAVDVAGFSGAEADQLRRAMGSKRSPEKMDRMKQRFYDGLRTTHGITGDVADRIYEKLYAFANFGFPESHSQSFASLVFYSSWLKLHHPAAFCAALLRAQPMGFYSPQTLVADARRHGVTVRRPCINASVEYPTLEDAGLSVRLGLTEVTTIGADLATAIVTERRQRGAYRDIYDLARRTQLSAPQLEALATAGALECFGTERRQALWQAGAAAQERPDRLPLTPGGEAPALPGLSATELAAADVWATGITPDRYPTEFLRDQLEALGVIPAHRLLAVPDGERVLVGGAVTHRQRPATASGVTFINLEDETGMVNVVCSVGLWSRYRNIAQNAPALLVRGTIQNAEGAVTVVADRLQRMDLRVTTSSRDWR